MHLLPPNFGVFFMTSLVNYVLWNFKLYSVWYEVKFLRIKLRLRPVLVYFIEDNRYLGLLALLQRLLKSLVDEEPKCCCSKNLQCWRYSLKEIKLINVKGFKSIIPVLNAATMKNLGDFLDEWAVEAQKIVKSFGSLKGETLSFQLCWWSCTNVLCLL